MTPQERKARRLSAAAWAERPALAVWPSEEDLSSTGVPLPATPYEGRLSRARKVNSERRAVMSTPRAVTNHTLQVLTLAAAVEGLVADIEAEAEEEVVAAAAEMGEVEEEVEEVVVEEEATVAKEEVVEAAVAVAAAKEVARASVLTPPSPGAAKANTHTGADEQEACSSAAANARAKFAAMGAQNKKAPPCRTTAA